ncbi:hypothetical protein ACS0TY_002548 [Phlomoides rotata]
MYLENIHDFGLSKEETPMMFADGTCLEPSPQSILLHHISGKSHNYQSGVLMQSMNPDIVTLT